MPASTSICRLCLLTDIRTIPIADTPLQPVFEKLTSNLLHTADLRPLSACYMCYAQLDKSYKLMLTSSKAEKALSKILEQNPELTNESVSHIDRQAFGLFEPLSIYISESIDHAPEPLEYEVKVEPDTDKDCQGLEIDFSPEVPASEEEDEKFDPIQEAIDIDEDMPLKNLSSKPSIIVKKVKVEKELDDQKVGASVKKPKLKQQNQPEVSTNRELKIRRESTSQLDESDYKCTSIKYQPNLKQSIDNKCFKKSNTRLAKKTRKPPLTKVYICIICDQQFSKKCDLKIHSMTHTVDKPFECKICSNRYKSEQSLRTHIKIHTEEKRHKCNICQRAFLKKGMLVKHIRSHTGERPYECNICQRRFSQKSYLRDHMFQHNGEKPYECDICHRRYSIKASLRGHILVEHSNKPLYECHVCKSLFKTKGNLNNHLKIHSDLRMHQCHVCQQSFRENWILTMHMKVHSKETPFECNICHHKFKHASSLAVHSKQHTGEKPYECHVCGRRFAVKGYFNLHLSTHTDEKPHECNVCHRRFVIRKYLLKHMKSHAGERLFECNICQRQFARAAHLKGHVKTHTDKILQA